MPSAPQRATPAASPRVTRLKTLLGDYPTTRALRRGELTSPRIAFDFAEADPIKLSANAPAGCKPSIHEPPEDTDTQQLSDAFSSALGQDAQQPGGGSGPMSATGAVSIGSSKSVNIECAKS